MEPGLSIGVTLVGCPSSGKTTVAAAVFARLKEDGIPAEFVPEYARLHIAAKRLRLGLRPTEKLVLDDQDQVEIMVRQTEWHLTVARACGPDVTVVADCSPLLPLLYMSPDFRRDFLVSRAALVQEAKRTVDLVFYLRPLPPQLDVLDPGRVHSHAEGLEVDRLIREVLVAEGLLDDTRLVALDGPRALRTATVLSRVYSRVGDRVFAQ